MIESRGILMFSTIEKTNEKENWKHFHEYIRL